jgi:hypothetical protein
VTSYESAKGGKVKGISPEAMKLLDACKPYKGSGNPLWEIDELNNIGKHRLILTVGGDVFCWADWIGNMSMVPVFRYKFSDPHFRGVYGHPKLNQDGEFPALEPVSKSQVVDGNALLPKLHQFVDFIDALIDKFLPVLE